MCECDAVSRPFRFVRRERRLLVVCKTSASHSSQFFDLATAPESRSGRRAQGPKARSVSPLSPFALALCCCCVDVLRWLFPQNQSTGPSGAPAPSSRAVSPHSANARPELARRTPLDVDKLRSYIEDKVEGFKIDSEVFQFSFGQSCALCSFPTSSRNPAHAHKPARSLATQEPDVPPHGQQRQTLRRPHPPARPAHFQDRTRHRPRVPDPRCAR